MGIAVSLVIIVVVGILPHWQINEFAITPGSAQPVAPLVTIHGLEKDAHPEKIMLTDVYLSQLTAWSYIWAHFQSHTQIISGNDLTVPGVPTSQLVAQGYVDMENSKEDAKVAALRSLGWTIPQHDVGATVYAVQVPSPAATAGISVGDRIVAVAGAPVTSSCDVFAAMKHHPVGTTVSLTLEKAKISPSGDITYAAAKPVAVTTVAPASSDAVTGCPGVSGPPTSVVGVGLEDAVSFTTPGDISISTPDIGGPSAGLAMTLTLIDQLSAGGLTGGRVIAATGTISPDGTVGDVGGVAEKTIAVENAGATVFIVPAVEVSTARAAAKPSLHVEGVTTLAQALKDLRDLGGSEPIPLTKPYPL